MRYSISGPSIQQTESECRKVGAANIRVMPLVRQVMADLEPAMVTNLTIIGLMVKLVKTVRASVSPPPTTLTVQSEASGLDVGEMFKPLRDYFDPPLSGAGLTVAVLGTGIRATHEAVKDRVVYTANLSTGPDGDIFDHDTGVASIIVGVSPGIDLMDIKVLCSDGSGTDETVVAGIEEVLKLVEVARNEGHLPSDALYPNVLNMSFGSEDDGDYNNIIRAACRIAHDEYELELIAAAGNGGPSLSTVTIPAVDDSVIAVGAMKTDLLEVCIYSSRGPSLDGQIKPDFVIWAENILTASSKGDQEYTSNSGTSFSAPSLSGARGLLCEMTARAQVYDVTWYDIRNLAPLFCVKAEGAPVRKDNDWGYGYPLLGRVASRILAAPSAGIDLGTLLTPMITMMMIVMMMGMVTQGMKGE